MLENDEECNIDDDVHRLIDPVGELQGSRMLPWCSCGVADFQRTSLLEVRVTGWWSPSPAFHIFWETSMMVDVLKQAGPCFH